MAIITAFVQCSGTSQAVIGSTAKDTCWELHDRNCSHI